MTAPRFRLKAICKSWDKECVNVDLKKERKNFYGFAVTQDFTAFWGADKTKLSAWRDLCRCVGIRKVPSSIEGSKDAKRQAICIDGVRISHAEHSSSQALEPIHVNLVDLVDSKRARQQPKVFNSEDALASYSRETEKIFPKTRAKANSLLRQFLAHVFN
ncbi:hypothetical protein ACG7TL_002329 [Trametes sanguinea]